MKKYIILFAMVFFIISCDRYSDSREEVQQRKVDENMTRLEKSEAIPELTKSLERKNIKRRLLLFEDENKVTYIYLISFGKIMAFYTVKGKVSSSGKRMTSSQQLVNEDLGVYAGQLVMESPELDGSYGSSGEYIFFWNTDGSYIQWNDKYMLCDKPLKLSTQPELIREIN